jgi:hypothetical protein
LLFLDDFLSLKNDVNLSQSNKQKNSKEQIIFVGVLKNDVNVPSKSTGNKQKNRKKLFLLAS